MKKNQRIHSNRCIILSDDRLIKERIGLIKKEFASKGRRGLRARDALLGDFKITGEVRIYRKGTSSTGPRNSNVKVRS